MIIKPQQSFIPSQSNISEANFRIPHKEEFKRFGMAVEFSIRDYLLELGKPLEFSEDPYAPYDWSVSDIWYDVKCSTNGDTHTISENEKNNWYSRFKNGYDTIILSTQRRSLDEAIFLKYISFGDLVRNRSLVRSHEVPNTYYFYYR